MRIFRTSKFDTSQYFNRCLFVDRNMQYSDDLIQLAGIQPTLTFDRRFLDPEFQSTIETPFLEITRSDPIKYYSDFSIDEKFTGSYESYLNELVECMGSVLLRIDPNKRYLLCHSSGSDSRIVSGTMIKLRKEKGIDFNNIEFYCWGRPEEDKFREIMDRGKWRNFSILNDFHENTFKIGDPTVSVGGWNGYQSQFKFWGDLDPSKYVLLTGAEGETFTRPYPEWVHSRGYFMDRGETLHRLSNVFSGLFPPYLTRDFLRLTMAMPKEWRNIKDPRLGRDKVRTDLVDLLGLADIAPANAAYNMNITPEIKNDMLLSYEKSRFYRDYRIPLDPEKLFKYQGGWDACAWGFAVTVYEPIMAARAR